MAEYGNINSGLVPDGGEENTKWDAGMYVQMSGNLVGVEKKLQVGHESDYLEINDAKNVIEMTKLNDENDEEQTYANVAEEVFDKKPTKEPPINKKKQKGKDSKKVMDSKKHNHKSHFYSVTNLRVEKPTKPTRKTNKKDESFYSYASPDFAPGNSLDKKEALHDYLKPVSDTVSNAGSLVRPKIRASSAPQSPVQLAQTSYVEPFDKLESIEEQNYTELQVPMAEKQDSFLGSLGKQSTTSSTSLIEKQGSSKAATKRKTNLMYEKTDPNEKQTNTSCKTKCIPASNYYNSAIRSNAKWRAFLAIVCMMILLTAVMLAFQIFGMFRKCCRNKNQEFAMSNLDKRVKYLEAQMLSRTKEISMLQRLTDYQKIQIENLHGLIKLKQLQNKQKPTDSAIRKRRDTVEANFRRRLRDWVIDANIRNGKLSERVREVNSSLVQKVKNMKLTPGPKGVTGPRGKHSLKGCKFVTNTANEIIRGDLNLFQSNVELTVPQGQTLTGVFCSSPYTKYVFFTPNKHSNIIKCTCNQAYSQGNGQPIECRIIAFLCRTIE